jgi:3-oxoacyl-(acyl-carrier-protein) synthase
MDERIVITGMGTINSLGHSVSATWEKLVNGVSAVGPITAFDTTDWNVKLACEVTDFDPTQHMDFKEARRRDRFQQFGVAAAKQALRDSELEVDGENAYRIGTVISSAVGGVHTLQEGVYTLERQGFRHVSPFVVPMMMPNGAASMTGIEFGIRGPSFGVVSACASGADSIGIAWTLLRSGMLDAALAGGAEATINSISVGAFDRAMAISRQTDPDLAPRPFDRNRDGLVMGEGSAVLALETESHARARGATIYAELAGYGVTADRLPHYGPTCRRGCRGPAMRMALQSATSTSMRSATSTPTPLARSSTTPPRLRPSKPPSVSLPMKSPSPAQNR